MKTLDERTRAFYRKLYTAQQPIDAIGALSSGNTADSLVSEAFSLTNDGLNQLGVVASRLNDWEMLNLINKTRAPLAQKNLVNLAQTVNTLRAKWNAKYQSARVGAIGEILGDAGNFVGGLISAGSNIVNGALAVPGDVAQWIGGTATGITQAAGSVVGGVQQAGAAFGGGMQILLIGGLAIAAIFFLKD